MYRRRNKKFNILQGNEEQSLEFSRNGIRLRQTNITELLKISKKTNKSVVVPNTAFTMELDVKSLGNISETDHTETSSQSEDTIIYGENESVNNNSTSLETTSPSSTIVIHEHVIFNDPTDVLSVEICDDSDIPLSNTGSDELSRKKYARSLTSKRKLIFDDTEEPSSVSPKKRMELTNNSTMEMDVSAPVDVNTAENIPTNTKQDDQVPSCSKSQSTKNNTTAGQKGLLTPRKINSTDSTNKSNRISPQKSPTSPKCLKKLNPKEGKQLQIKQLDELIKLFKGVSKNCFKRKLLNEAEYKILKRFISLEDNRKYVVMKLFVWKKMWYNIFSFSKKANLIVNDDKDIIDIFENLKQEEFVDTMYNKVENLLELLNTLGHDKIKEIMIKLKIKPIKSKPENVKLILQVASRQRTLPGSKSFKEVILNAIENKMGFSFKISDQVCDAFFNVCLLSTFVNPEFQDIQKYFQSIVYDKIVFPKVSIENYPVFVSRQQFLDYGKALKVKLLLDDTLSKIKETKLGILNIGNQAYLELQQSKLEERDKVAPHLYKFRAVHVYSKILSLCCNHIYTKKDGFPNEAKKWLEYLIQRFPESRYIGFWYQKLIWLHMRHLNEISYEKAAKLLIEVLENKAYKLNILSIYELAKLGTKLKQSKKYKIDQLYHDKIAQLMPRTIKEDEIPQEQIDSTSIRHLEQTGVKKNYITVSSDEITIQTVEQVALNYYADNGYPEGIHCESSLVNGLLLLFFWDIIYNPSINIPAIFIEPIQQGPLDIFTEYFYDNRKDLFKERLNEISCWSVDKLIDFAKNNWKNHCYKVSIFGLIQNAIRSLDIIPKLINVIGRKLLTSIFARLIEDLRMYRSGMPDLLIWNIEKQHCKFVEVKSENDRLAVNQLLWLKYLKDNGADVAVCWVHSRGSKRKIIKSSPVKSKT